MISPSGGRRKMRMNCRSGFVCWMVVASLLLVTIPGFSQTSAAPSAPPADETFKLLPSLNKDVMDPAADPCVDFYRYACGNWSKSHPIPSDSPYSDQFYVLDQYNHQVLHAILEKAAPAGSARDANTQKIGDYYASCSDEAAIQQKALAPLQPELDRISKLTSKD